MSDDEIEITNSNIISVDFSVEGFTIEYNIDNSTWIAYPSDEEEFDYNVVIEGEIVDSDGTRIDYEMLEDLEVFGYILTTEEFEELKLGIFEQI